MGRVAAVLACLGALGCASSASAATPQIFSVANASPSGAGSLAQAITDSNSNGPGPNTIDFSIAGSGVKTIQPTSALPSITVPVMIDGTSEPGFAGTPLIDLDGTNAGSGTPGLTLSSVSNVTVKGLEITTFSGPGIEIDGGSGNVIAGNEIGTDGSSAAGNGEGVLLDSGTQNNTIGGTGAGTGNVISGNSGTGVELDNAGFNTVAGNLIGTDPAGTAALQNGTGVGLSDGSHDNTIGGATATARNVISGNGFDGVQFNDAGGPGNVVEGDYIGTNAAGTAALGNGTDGVHMINGTQGETVGAGDVISGNGRDGVEFESGSPITPTSANTVEGDMIGTDAGGTAALPNTGAGVSISGGTNITVGGTTATARNVISGNSGDGIDVSSGVDGVGNLVEGDYIGTNGDGTAALGNGGDGVNITASTRGTTIGGTGAGAGNVISANTVTGVAITAGSQTTVAGDLVGTNANGAGKLGNGSNGVVVGTGATTSTVGGTSASARNVISGNTGNGVLINGAHTTLVEGDYIGTTAGGTAALANSAAGVSITAGADGTTIGGTTAAARNLVSGNTGDGVSISTDANVFSNVVEGDYIGLGADGSTPIGNGSDGVHLFGTTSAVKIGTTATGAGNAIAHSGGDGVHVDGVNANRDTILSNSIFSNLGSGIALTSGANGGEAPPSVSVDTSGATSTIAGTVTSGSHEVQIFENASCGDPEGASLIGDTSTTGTTLSLAVGNLPAGKGLTATSTNSSASRTSGFSSCATTTTTTLGASPGAGVPGQPVTYTATIDPGTATGIVAFTDSGNPIPGCGAVPVNGGTAACRQTYATAGGHSIQATYSATGAFGGSDSSALTEPVQIATATATVRASTGRAVTGQGVTFTAAVAPAPLGGTVSFHVAGKVMAGCAAVPVPTSTGTATCSTAFGAPGKYLIAVAYSGDAGHTGSSATLVETVGSSVALIGSPSGRGGAVKFTVRCAAGSGGCRLSATLRAGRKAVGAKTTTVSAGKKVTVTVRLNSAGRRMLGRARKLVVRFVLSAKADGGTTRITRRTVNVTAPGARSKKKK